MREKNLDFIARRATKKQKTCAEIGTDRHGDEWSCSCCTKTGRTTKGKCEEEVQTSRASVRLRAGMSAPHHARGIRAQSTSTSARSAGGRLRGCACGALKGKRTHPKPVRPH
jgi:hypothetical protein